MVIGYVPSRLPEGRPRMSDKTLLSGISGLSFDSHFLSPLLFVFSCLSCLWHRGGRPMQSPAESSIIFDIICKFFQMLEVLLQGFLQGLLWASHLASLHLFTKTWNKTYIQKHQKDTFEELINPFIINIVETVHKTRTCWYRWPFRLPVQARIDNTLITICHNFFLDSISRLSYFLSMYTPSRQLHSSADTRILGIPHIKTSYCAPMQWHSSPSYIRHTESSFAFKTALKIHLYNNNSKHNN